MIAAWQSGLPEVSVCDRVCVERAETFLEYRFRDPRLARCALTSPGWLNEHPGSGWPTWKALEWQGDAVLYLVLTEHMVAAGEAMTTGNATWARDQLKSNALLAERAVEGLWDALLLGNGERFNNAHQGWKSYVADSVEALIGAVWFDASLVEPSPLPVARRVVLTTLGLGA